jgi:hypothetical protein
LSLVNRNTREEIRVLKVRGIPFQLNRCVRKKRPKVSEESSVIYRRPAIMPVMSTETAGEDQQATAVTIKHESSSSASMHQLLSNSVSAATASSAGGMGGGTIGGIVGSEHSPSPTTLCGGCGFKITDRYYLVAVERAWHSECLRCGECRRPLDTALSCFSRQSRIYCRDDYYR